MKVIFNPLVLVPFLIGVISGPGLFAFIYARGYSYLSDRSESCINCHIMGEQYRGWVAGSHRSAAQCNDCHTPPGVVGKYFAKIKNGVHHSWSFTTGDYEEPIHIGAKNHQIAESACVKCHGAIFPLFPKADGNRALHCLACHRNAGH